MRRLLLLFLPLVFVVQCTKNHQNNRTPTAPGLDPGLALQGAGLYAEHCASCHGKDGQGGAGPKLTDSVSCPSCGSEQTLTDVIAARMPPNQPGVCDRSCAAQIAQYIRSEFLKEPDSCDDASITPGQRALRLLTNREYENTVKSLFHLPDTVSFASTFLAETKVEGFSTNHQQAVANTRRVEDWLAAAHTVVEQANLESSLGCDFAKDPRCIFANFTTKLFRRPLTTAEVQFYSELMDRQGLKTALQSMLISPAFLYRSERGVLQADGFYHLTPYEIAAALSYMFLETTPDDQLLKLAADGSLADKNVIRTQALRLLKMPEAKRMTAQFAVEWLNVTKILDTKDTQGDLTPAMRANMLNETKAMFNYITFDAPSQRFADLFTAPFTYINADLAQYYGLHFPENGGSDFAITPYDGHRTGILGHGSILVASSHPDQTSPILRGVFVRDRLLCQKLPPPPPNLNIVLPKVDPTLSTRERFTQHASAAVCKNCHQYIDPVGFGFENFDATGRYRTTENGKAIDSRGQIMNLSQLSQTPQQTLEFSSLGELASIISSSATAKECFAFQFYRYSRGVAGSAQDRCASRKASRSFVEGPLTIQDMMVEQTQSPSFVLKK